MDRTVACDSAGKRRPFFNTSAHSVSWGLVSSTFSNLDAAVWFWPLLVCSVCRVSQCVLSCRVCMQALTKFIKKNAKKSFELPKKAKKDKDGEDEEEKEVKDEL